MKRRVMLDDTDTLVLELQASPNEETFTGTPHWLSVSDFQQSHPRLCVVFERLFPAISIQGYVFSGDRLSCECIISCVGWIIAGYDRRRWPGPPIIVAYALFDPGCDSWLIGTYFYYLRK